MTNNANALAEQVQQAFTAAQAGNYDAISALAGQPGVLPHLSDYLNNPSEDIRLQAISLLNGMTDPASLPLLAIALNDTEQDLRNRASVMLYQNFDPNQLANNPGVAQALQQSIRRGNDAAAAILLLGYFPSEGTTDAIAALLETTDTSTMTELFTWSPVVSVHRVVEVTQSRLGDRNARLTLLKSIAANDATWLEFLLSVIRDIDAPEVLHSLADVSLLNASPIDSGVPSGVSPQRRIQDLAVAAFVERLNLSVDFELTDFKRYSEAETHQVLAAIRKTLPR